VLIVENDAWLRDSLGQLLEENGYEVSLANNGREALTLLRSAALPNLIVFDLKMPVMDGWEFRAIQKDDPKLGLVPVLVISADARPQAVAISAHGYLRKPFDSKEVLAAVERILSENEGRLSARLDETERLTSLGRVAANVGHEINNPLTFVMLNLRQSITDLNALCSAILYAEAVTEQSLPSAALEQLKSRILGITAMLQECETGGERIRGTITNLQRLSWKSVAEREPLDMNELLEESASMVSHQIRHRARFTKRLGDTAPVRGNRAALGQVFLNLLVNAAQAIPEGNADQNEIQVTTRIDAASGVRGAEVVIEVRDSGAGIAPELVSRVFEPYFTTKPQGGGMGLGLSISRQAISDHDGRMTIESEVGKGTVFRVFLPVDGSPIPPRSVANDRRTVLGATSPSQPKAQER
jgi:signal transduction histidine kinase